jgi:hypothetical protein
MARAASIPCLRHEVALFAAFWASAAETAPPCSRVVRTERDPEPEEFDAVMLYR